MIRDIAEFVAVEARLAAGLALCEAASWLAAGGRTMLGNPRTALQVQASKGTDVIVLDRRVPMQTPAVRLVNPDRSVPDTIAKVRKVHNRVLTLDRQLAYDYPAAAAVKVLV